MKDKLKILKEKFSVWWNRWAIIFWFICITLTIILFTTSPSLGIGWLLLLVFLDLFLMIWI